ncbi:MAG: ras guanine nucleotide exchange factor domain-containing protein [Benjaminiella poitrasii]|nr:MAG: ras guanine nucleotide exchange factor domain-containing protein [Benjaminiella poitrasii]
MWISSKFNTLIYKRKATVNHISYVLGIAATTLTIRKSTLLINLGLVECFQHNNKLYQGKLYRLKDNTNFIIQIIEFIGIPTNLDLLDGVLICYDTTSMEELPNIISTLLSNQIPSILIGLDKPTALSSPSTTTACMATMNQCQKSVGGHYYYYYGIPVLKLEEETSVTTTFNIQLLQRQFRHFIYSDRLVLISLQQQGFCRFVEGNNDDDDEGDSDSHGHSETVVAYSDVTVNDHEDDTIQDVIDQALTCQEQGGNNRLAFIFLTVYRRFMKPIDLLNHLFQRFRLDLVNTNQKLPTQRQERIQTFLVLWLTQYWNDFKCTTTRQTLIHFVNQLNQPELQSIHDSLRPLAMQKPPLTDKDQFWSVISPSTNNSSRSSPKDATSKSNRSTTSLLKRAISAHSYNYRHRSNSILGLKAFDFPSLPHQTNRLLKRRNSSSTMHDTKTMHTIGSLIYSFPKRPDAPQGVVIRQSLDIVLHASPQQMAEQLTWIETKLFKRVQSRDFLRHLYCVVSQQHDYQSPLVCCIEHFNFVSNWITCFILSQSQLDKRVIALDYCIQIAIELLSLNNFNSLMAVLAGVNSAPILRLKQTRASMQLKNQRLFNQFLDLEILMNSERSFYHYRAKLREATERPSIPYLGVHQQDLVSLNQANKDKTRDGKIHWKKFVLMGEVIIDIIRCQQSVSKDKRRIKPDFTILGFIQEFGLKRLLTEDERYEKSIKLEPKRPFL